MNGLRPIETTYRGHRFRSRLEARWAVFLDALGVEWWYEHEGYDLGDGPFGKRLLYLPDFYIPEQRGVSGAPFFMEIKGEKPTLADVKKMSALVVESGQKVHCFVGPPRPSRDLPDPEDATVRHLDGVGDDTVFANEDFPYCWCECPTCGTVGIAFEGRSDRLACKESAWKQPVDAGCPRSAPNADKGYNDNSPRLQQAYLAAKTARFGR